MRNHYSWFGHPDLANNLKKGGIIFFYQNSEKNSIFSIRRCPGLYKTTLNN